MSDTTVFTNIEKAIQEYQPGEDMQKQMETLQSLTQRLYDPEYVRQLEHRLEEGLKDCKTLPEAADLLDQVLSEVEGVTRGMEEKASPKGIQIQKKEKGVLQKETEKIKLRQAEQGMEKTLRNLTMHVARTGEKETFLLLGHEITAEKEPKGKNSRLERVSLKLDGKAIGVPAMVQELSRAAERESREREERLLPRGRQEREQERETGREEKTFRLQREPERQIETAREAETVFHAVNREIPVRSAPLERHMQPVHVPGLPGFLTKTHQKQIDEFLQKRALREIKRQGIRDMQGQEEQTRQQEKGRLIQMGKGRKQQEFLQREEEQMQRREQERRDADRRQGEEAERREREHRAEEERRRAMEEARRRQEEAARAQAEREAWERANSPEQRRRDQMEANLVIGAGVAIALAGIQEEQSRDGQNKDVLHPEKGNLPDKTGQSLIKEQSKAAEPLPEHGILSRDPRKEAERFSKESIPSTKTPGLEENRKALRSDLMEMRNVEISGVGATVLKNNLPGREVNAISITEATVEAPSQLLQAATKEIADKISTVKDLTRGMPVL